MGGVEADGGSRNDAHYTLEAFERMMDETRVAPVVSKVVVKEETAEVKEETSVAVE